MRGSWEGGDRRVARATFALLLFIFLKRDGDACVRTADRLLTALRCVLGGGAGAGVARVKASSSPGHRPRSATCGEAREDGHGHGSASGIGRCGPGDADAAWLGRTIGAYSSLYYYYFFFIIGASHAVDCPPLLGGVCLSFLNYSHCPIECLIHV